MVYAEFSINFEAITPVTLFQNEGSYRGQNAGQKWVEYNLLPGEKANTKFHYYNEFQAYNMNENLPLMPQIAERIYKPDASFFNEDAYAAQEDLGFYIKSGLVKVTIHHPTTPNKTIPFIELVGVGPTPKEMVQLAQPINPTKIRKKRTQFTPKKWNTLLM